VVQLTYNIANHLGSSCWEPRDGGLTRAGHRMVAALNDAGVLVDISHVGNRTGRDAVEASGRPIAVTHGNPASFCPSDRNKPDDLIDALAARGGVIGCTLYPLFMGGAGVSRASYFRMVADLAERIGVRHVAIGSDAVVGWEPDALGWMRNGRWDRPSDPDQIPAFPPWPPWFQGPEDFGSLAEGLDDAGFLPGERDAVIVRVEVSGLAAGRRKRVIYQVVDYRDLETGFLAMQQNRPRLLSMGREDQRRLVCA
ncbi:MAG TPA: hypothetical protein EYP40_04595, partial [Chromatiales bacterium]|nr:hypothetical protein [Chromatiales bacterium]